MTSGRILASDLNLLPHDAEAERIVAGSILIDPDALPRAQGSGLKPEDFHSMAMGWVYEAAINASLRGDPVELGAIGRELERTQAAMGIIWTH
jgi:replicative DNA helicase